MTESANLSLPYLAPQQAQKHVTVNEALRRLDILSQIVVQDRDLSSPPPAPAEGAAYIAAAAPQGAWSDGAAGDLFAFQDGAWARISPNEGWVAWIADEDALAVWDGSAWTGIGADGASPTGAALFGVNASADATNRLSVKSDAALFSHDDATPGSGDARVIVNKASAAETASVVFQSNFSGRAEMGLAGEDAFSFKVSADGAAFQEALRIDPATRRTTLQDLRVANIDAGGNVSVLGETWRTAQLTVNADAAWGQFKVRRARGTTAAPQSVRAGDTIFGFTPEGYDGAGYQLAGGLQFIAESDFDAGVSAYFRIATVDAGVWGERLRVRGNGDVGVGVSTPATKLDVDGPVRPKSYAVSALPSASGVAGAIVFVSDASGGATLAFSDGAAWRRVQDRAEVS